MHTSLLNTSLCYKIAIATAVWLAGALVFFRDWIFSGLLPGDAGDARIMLFLLEHIVNSVIGSPLLLSPPQFYPVRDTLGFSDTHLLLAPIYGFFRLFSDPFAAFGNMFIALSAIGFCGLFYLLHRELQTHFFPSLVGSIVFCFSNLMAFKITHGQSYAIMFAPWIVVLLCKAWSRKGHKLSIAVAACAGLLLGLLLTTSYVIGWFLSVMFIGGGLFAVIVSKAWKQQGMHILLLGFFVGLLLDLLPFIAIYGNIIRQGYSRTIQDIRSYAPRFLDIINIGYNNFIWEGVLSPDALGRTSSVAPEIYLGFTPILLVFALCGFGYCARVAISRESVSFQTRFAATLLGSTLIISLLLLVLNFDYGVVYPWSYVFNSIPGAVGIRSTFRMQIVNYGLYAILAALALDRFIRASGKRLNWTYVVAVMMGLLLMIEQVNRSLSFYLPASEQRMLLAQISPAPPPCKAFAYLPAGNEGAWWVSQSNALMISMKFGLPTINGNSSNYPRGWELLDPLDPAYRERIQEWGRTHGLDHGLCLFDMSTKQWKTS